MRKRTLENLDNMFQHYVRNCFILLAAGTAGVAIGVAVLQDGSGTAEQAAYYVLTGIVIGTILCLLAMRFLKSRFHSKIQAELSRREDSSA